MNAARRLELQASLQRELARYTAEHGLSSTGRVSWLLDQVENYVERWNGIRAISTHSTSSPSDDLFHMIEIGAEVTSREMLTLESTPVVQSWNSFLAILSQERERSNIAEPQRLTKLLAAVRTAIVEELKPHRDIFYSHRITSRYSDIDGVVIDPLKIPEQFRHLVSLAKYWSVGDDVERINLMCHTPFDELRSLTVAVRPLRDEIWQWCSSHHGDIPVPDEVVIFDMLSQASAEAEVMHG